MCINSPPADGEYPIIHCERKTHRLSPTCRKRVDRSSATAYPGVNHAERPTFEASNVLPRAGISGSRRSIASGPIAPKPRYGKFVKPGICNTCPPALTRWRPPRGEHLSWFEHVLIPTSHQPNKECATSGFIATGSSGPSDAGDLAPSHFPVSHLAHRRAPHNHSSKFEAGVR